MSGSAAFSAGPSQVSYAKPSRTQYSKPPSISFTWNPSSARASAARVAPLQPGPQQYVTTGTDRSSSRSACSGMSVAGEEGGEVGVAVGERGEPLLAELPDRVHVRGVQRDGRVVEGDEHGYLVRGAGEDAVQPLQGLVLEEALVLAGDGGVAEGDDEALAPEQLVDGGAGAVVVPGGRVEEAGPEGGPVVVVPGADEQRVPGAEELPYDCVLVRAAVVGDVSGDEDRRQVVRQLLQVPQDGAGAVDAARFPVDMDVADMGDDDHVARSSVGLTGGWVPSDRTVIVVRS